MKLNELRKISLDFRRLASNALKTKYDEGDIHLIRLRRYMKDNKYIQEIINNEIEGVYIDYKTEFVENNGSRKGLNFPIEHKVHIKAIIDYFDDLTEGNVDVRGEAHHYMCSSNKLDDIIRNFVEKLIKPLIDFVTDAISIDIISKEQEIAREPNITQYINSNYGTANVTSGNITSSNMNVINEVAKIDDLAETIKRLIKESKCSHEIVEDYLDDIETIQENVKSKELKKVKLKKALRGVSKFLSSIPTSIKTAQLIVSNSEKLTQAVQRFMENLS